LKKGSFYLYWRQAAMSILEAGSPCPCFEKKAVFIYNTGGRQPCPFWRLAVNVLWIWAVHVHVLKKGSLYLYWRQAVHVHVLKKWQSLSILEAGTHVHSGGRQSMSILEADSLYLHWRQAAMSILEAGCPCPCFEKKAVLIYTGSRQPCPFWRQAVHVQYFGSPCH
jgi:hypothetical protein